MPEPVDTNSEELEGGCEGVAFGLGHSPVIDSDLMRLLVDLARDAREGIGIQNGVTFRRIVKETANFHDVAQIDQAWVAAGGSAPPVGSSAKGSGSLDMGKAFMDEVIKTSTGKANTDAEAKAREQALETNAGKLPPSPRGTVAARADHSKPKLETPSEIDAFAFKAEDVDSFVRGIVTRLARGGEVGTTKLTPKRILELDSPEKFEAEVRRAALAGLREMSAGSDATGTGEVNSQLEFFKEAVQSYLDNELSKYSKEAFKEVNLPKGDVKQGVMSGISRQSLMAEVDSALDGFTNTLHQYLLSTKGRAGDNPVNLPQGDVKQEVLEGAADNLGKAYSDTGEAIDATRTDMGARTVFDWHQAAKLGGRIADTYFPPGSKYRDPQTPKDLAYYGGYIYERLTKMDGKRPTASTWAAYMKASTGHDITGGDLKTAWEAMREVAFNTRVRPQVDIRNAAIRKANQLLSPEQLKKFLEETKAIDVNAKDAHAQYRQAINNLRAMDAMEFVRELPGLRRAVRTTFDLSALLNQGNTYALNPFTPRRNKQNIMHMLKAFANRKYAEAVIADLWNSPTGKMIQISNPGLLSTIGEDLPISAKEESFATRLLDGVIAGSHANEPYQAFNPAQSLPALAAVAVGLPLSLVTFPFIALPVAAMSAKLGQYAARKIKWQGTRPIHSVARLDLSTGMLNGLANKIEKSFQYINHLGDSVPTWDKAVSFEVGLAGAVPGLNKRVFGNPSSTGVMGALASQVRSGVRAMGGSESAYTVVLNVQRVQAYKEVADILISQGILQDTNPEVYEALGRVVGALTGRADVGWLEDHLPLLSMALFSPRFQAANLQTINPIGGAPSQLAISAVLDSKLSTPGIREKYQRFYSRGYIPPQVRKHWLKSMAGWVAGMGTLLTLGVLAGAAVMLDPRHRDFLKWRFAHKVYDFSGGKANWVRLLVQTLLTQQKITARKGYHEPGFVLPGDLTGQKLTELDGKGMASTGLEEITRSMMGKSNPMITDIISMTTGQDGMGRPVYRGRFKKTGVDDPDAWKEGFIDLAYNFGPLSPIDLMDAISDEDSSITERLIGAITMLGANAQDAQFDKKKLR